MHNAFINGSMSVKGCEANFAIRHYTTDAFCRQGVQRTCTFYRIGRYTEKLAETVLKKDTSSCNTEFSSY